MLHVEVLNLGQHWSLTVGTNLVSAWYTAEVCESRHTAPVRNTGNSQLLTSIALDLLTVTINTWATHLQSFPPGIHPGSFAWVNSACFIQHIPQPLDTSKTTSFWTNWKHDSLYWTGHHNHPNISTAALGFLDMLEVPLLWTQHLVEHWSGFYRWRELVIVSYLFKKKTGKILKRFTHWPEQQLHTFS